MRPSKIRSLIKIVENSNIDELEISSWGSKVRIRKRIGGSNGHGSSNTVDYNPPPRQADTQLELTAEAPNEKAATRNLVEIKSPMVGTFYKAPAPDARPYVEVGQDVKPGQVVCIIEAMKLMNEVEAEFAGRVIEILVENAKPVQFGQALFLVEPQ